MDPPSGFWGPQSTRYKNDGRGGYYSGVKTCSFGRQFFVRAQHMRTFGSNGESAHSGGSPKTKVFAGRGDSSHKREAHEVNQEAGRGDKIPANSTDLGQAPEAVKKARYFRKTPRTQGGKKTCRAKIFTPSKCLVTPDDKQSTIE